MAATESSRTPRRAPALRRQPLDGVGDAARRRRLAGDIRGLDPSVRADAGALAKRRYDDGPA